MPNADFFARLGLFVIKDFFDTETLYGVMDDPRLKTYGFPLAGAR